MKTKKYREHKKGNHEKRKKGKGDKDISYRSFLCGEELLYGIDEG